MSWDKVPFESLYLEPSRNGVYKSKEFHGEGSKIVNMGELFGFEFIGNQDMKRLKMSDTEIEKNGLIDGDLLFGRRSLMESGAGKCSIVIEPVEPITFDSSIIRVRLNKERVIPLFYYYWFQSFIGRAGIKAIVSGTNVKGIRGSDLKNVLVAFPNKDIQSRIINICKSYDNLIENNRRRIQLLEESARLLYREWFVHLRFPSHEHSKIVDGVPEGWEKRTIDDVANTIGGGTPSTKNPEYWEDGDVPWFSPTDLTKNDGLVLLDSGKKITASGLKESSAKLLPPKTILMSSRASIGYFGIFDGFASTNQGFISLIPKEEYLRWYLLFNLRGRVEEIIGLASGTTFKEISKTTFRAIPIIVPTKAITEQFYDFFDDIYKQVKVIKKQTVKLVEARDLILPRLMNGEISV